MATNDKKITTLWLDKSTRDLIDEEVVANIRCSNRSDVIRLALDDYFDKLAIHKPTKTNINIIRT